MLSNTDTTTELLAAPARFVDEALSQRVDGRRLAPNLRDAIRYALLGPGKRLRPALAHYSAMAVGANPALAMPAMEAIELVHCFSLVHDDLPSMDDDDLRRGRPTLHIHTSEAMAILAGDAMLAMAFEAIGNAGTSAGLLATELAPAVTDMISGQVLDTLGGGEAGSARDKLEHIHRGKTGALIRAACRMGVMCAARPAVYSPALDAGVLKEITVFADALGLMFQIVDDVLDVEQSTEQLGKRSGKDAAAGKLTYPGVLGLEESKAEIERQLNVCLTSIKPLGSNAKPLADLAHAMAVRTR